MLLCCLAVFLTPLISQASEVSFTLACSPTNDLFNVLKKNGLHPKRYSSVERAIQSAGEGSAVLLLADDYPDKTLSLSSNVFAEAAAKNLRLYVEFPSMVPGVELGQAKTLDWQRLVVNAENLGADLPHGRIMMAHEDYVQSVSVPNPLLVSARVAGYDNAVYGIPTNALPVLFTLDSGRVFVATTRLSDFVTGRFAPAAQWNALWRYILRQLAQTDVAPLKWTPRVQTQFASQESLPSDVEKKTFRNAASWFYSSLLLLTENRWTNIQALLKENKELTSTPTAKDKIGDGRFGILEGYSSGILPNGDQQTRTPVRADCQAETAMVLALDSVVNRNSTSRTTASNLLDFLYFNSDLCQGARGNPKNPAFGLVSWGSTSTPWMVGNYGDDNARVMLATMLSAACLKSDRWDEMLLRALEANLRTTGKLGFRGDRVDVPALEKHGWKHFHDAETINYSPHFESYNWACFLWAYRQTGDREFLDKTKNGIKTLMDVYPDKWRWDDNSERARILLCLAWLTRVEDTPEHRHWVEMIADDLIRIQDKTGAIPEHFRGAVASHYQIAKSNEAYGTGETPLLQENGDPVSDQLYVSGFVLLGLHEAFRATGDAHLKAAEDKLAEYLCRIQIQSQSIPYLNGTWFRAFDFKKWEAWASSGDFGWGAWSVESGWAQSWTACVLALRDQKTTLWDYTANSRITDKMARVREAMSMNTGGPWESTAK